MTHKGIFMSRNDYFRYAFDIAPLSFILMFFMGIISGVVGLLGTYSTERLFISIESGEIHSICMNIAIYGILLILSELYIVWYMHFHVQFHSVLRFEAKVRTIMHEKSASISNEQIESPLVFSQIKRAEGCQHHLFRYAQIRIELITMLISALMIISYISAMNIWFALIIPIAITPILIKSYVKRNILDKNYYRMLELKKEENEFERVLRDERYLSENKISGASSFLADKFIHSRNYRLQKEEEQTRRLFFINIATSIFESLGSVGGFLISVILYHRGEITVSELTAGVAAYSFLLSMLKSVSSSIANGEIYKKLVSPYFEFVQKDERSGKKDGISFTNSIELKDVGFVYPANKNPSIQNINIRINKGDVIAIVGENGSGKTTLANIILGLYEPSTGTVLYDGKDIVEYKESSIHEKQSTVSQNFIRYKMSVKENILLGSFKKEDDLYIRCGIKENLGTNVSEKTILGKELGGVELSGGEWQRLAILRGFYKVFDFIVLDEPTSAIDPVKEKALYDEFAQKLKGKTGIIITHRLASVSLADRIIVMKDGRIAESGTHDELLSLSGEYSRLWNAQCHL